MKGLFRSITGFKMEEKAYYAGVEPHLRYFMRPRSGSRKEFEVIDRQTGKVHGTYNQRGTAAQITNHLNGVPNA